IMENENEVTVETEEVPLAESTMAEYKKARADGKETATREAPAESRAAEGKVEEEKPRIRGGFQAKIDRLIKQQASLEEAKTAAEKRANELEQKLNGNGAAKDQTDPNAEPVREKFQTEAEYIRALTRWEVRQEIKAE